MVKTSWPESSHTRETHFLKMASERAERSPEQWTAIHLPRLFYPMDAVFDGNMPTESILCLFKNSKLVYGNHKYK